MSLIVTSAVYPTARPGIAYSDALSRSGGDRKAEAVRIGEQLFQTRWPAQVLNVYADGVGPHLVAGLRISGQHFHAAITRDEFIAEIANLVQRSFAAAPLEEVDVWASVPLQVGKDVIVSGDLARPTSKNVFTISVLRTESVTSLVQRMRSGDGVFWDQDWERAAFKSHS